jgi:hypothetical protein
MLCIKKLLVLEQASLAETVDEPASSLPHNIAIAMQCTVERTTRVIEW